MSKRYHSRPSRLQLVAARHHDAPVSVTRAVTDNRGPARFFFTGNIGGFWGDGELDEQAGVISFAPFFGDA